MSRKFKHLSLITVFFGGLLAILLLQETAVSKNTARVQAPPLSSAGNEPPPSCSDDNDCSEGTDYCHEGVCTALSYPTCSCSQTLVLRCQEPGGRTKYTYCVNGCSAIKDTAICI